MNYDKDTLNLLLTQLFKLATSIGFVSEESGDTDFLIQFQEEGKGHRYQKVPGRSGKWRVDYYCTSEKIEKYIISGESLFTLGAQDDADYGLDLLFYNGKSLVGYVISHEEMLFIEEKYKEQFGFCVVY